MQGEGKKSADNRQQQPSVPPSVMTLQLSRKLKRTDGKQLEKDTVLAVLNDRLNQGRWRWLHPQSSSKLILKQSQNAKQMKIEIDLKNTELEKVTKRVKVSASVIDFRINDQNKTISAHLLPTHNDNLSSSSSDEDGPSTVSRQQRFNEQQYEKLHPILQQMDHRMHGRKALMVTGGSRKSTTVLGANKTSSPYGAASIIQMRRPYHQTRNGSNGHKHLDRLMMHNQTSKTIRRFGGNENVRDNSKGVKSLVPISKLRANTLDRNDMFSDKMQKIEQNMITMFDKLLEPQEQDVNLSIQKATQSILQNRFQYKSTKITDLKFVNQNDIRQLLEADNAQKNFAFNQYLNRVKQHQTSHKKLQGVDAFKNNGEKFDMEDRSRIAVDRAKKISRLSQESQVSSLLKKSAIGSAEPTIDPDGKEIYVSEGVSRQLINMNENTLQQNGHLSHEIEKAAQDIIDLQTTTDKMPSQTFERGNSSIPSDKNEESAKHRHSPGGHDGQIFTAQYHIQDNNTILVDTPGTNELHKYEQGMDLGSSLGAASPNGQVIIIEKEFGGLDFVQKPSAKIGVPIPIKSPSIEQNSTDVNQSHVLSDHFTAHLVPMSIHDIQHYDQDVDTFRKGDPSPSGAPNSHQKPVQQKEQTLTRHEKDKQSRYLLRNQRMRLFSPITKAKYQHEILMRQSEQIDKAIDHESFKDNDSESLPTMLRVFRAVSPQQEAQNQQLMAKTIQSVSQGAMAQNQKSQPIVQMNINLKLQGQQQQQENSKIGANIMINGVACKPLSGDGSQTQQVRCGILSFRNDLGSLKESHELRKNGENISESPSSRRRPLKIGHSLEQSKVDVGPLITLQELPDDERTGQHNLLVDDETPVAAKIPRHSMYSTQNTQQTQQTPIKVHQSQTSNDYSGKAGEKRNVFFNHAVVDQQQQKINEFSQAVKMRNQCTSITPPSIQTPMMPINIQNYNPNADPYSPAQTDKMAHLVSSEVTTANLRTPNSKHQNNNTIEGDYGGVTNEPPQINLINTTNVTEESSKDQLMLNPEVSDVTYHKKSKIKIIRPVLYNSQERVAANANLTADAIAVNGSDTGLSFNRQNASESPQTKSRQNKSPNNGTDGGAGEDTGRNTVNLGRELAEIVHNSMPVSKEGCQIDMQLPQQPQRTNLDQIVLSSLKESALQDQLKENQQSAIEAYHGTQSFGSTQIYQKSSKKGGGTGTGTMMSFSSGGLKQHLQKPMVKSGATPSKTTIQSNDGPYFMVSTEQAKPLDETPQLAKEAPPEFENEYASAVIGKDFRQRIGKYNTGAHVRNTIEKLHPQNNSYSGNSVTNSIDSFNYRIKAIDGNQAVNIFNFDRQKAQDHQQYQGQGRKLKSDQLFTRPPHLYPPGIGGNNNRMAPPSQLKQRSKGVGVEYGVTKQPNLMMFEPAVWTEVKQIEGSLNCQQAQTKAASRTISNQPAMKDSVCQFQSINAKTMSIDRPNSINQVSQPQSGTTTPLGIDTRLKNQQSPLKMWKKMNDQNWERIKQDGYIPIPLKSTKSMTLKRVQNSQTSKIKPVLTNEQLNQLNHHHRHQVNPNPMVSQTILPPPQSNKSLSAAEQFRKRKRGINLHMISNNSSSATQNHQTIIRRHKYPTPCSRDDAQIEGHHKTTIDDTGSVKLSFMAHELQDFKRPQDKLKQDLTTVNLQYSGTGVLTNTIGSGQQSWHRQQRPHNAQTMTQMTIMRVQPKKKFGVQGAWNSIDSYQDSVQVASGQQPVPGSTANGEDLMAEMLQMEEAFPGQTEVAVMKRSAKSQQMKYRPGVKGKGKHLNTKQGSRNQIPQPKFLSLQTLGPPTVIHPSEVLNTHTDGPFPNDQVQVITLVRSTSPKSEEGRMKPQLQTGGKINTFALKTNDYELTHELLSRKDSRDNTEKGAKSPINAFRDGGSKFSVDKDTSILLRRNLELQQTGDFNEHMNTIYKEAQLEKVAADGLDYEMTLDPTTPQAVVVNGSYTTSKLINKKRLSFPHHNTMTNESISKLNTRSEVKYVAAKIQSVESWQSNNKKHESFKRGVLNGVAGGFSKENSRLSNQKSERSRFSRKMVNQNHSLLKQFLPLNNQQIQNTQLAIPSTNMNDLQVSGQIIQTQKIRKSVVSLENQIKRMKDSLHHQALEFVKPDEEQDRAIEKQKKLVCEIQHKRTQHKIEAQRRPPGFGPPHHQQRSVMRGSVLGDIKVNGEQQLDERRGSLTEGPVTDGRRIKIDDFVLDSKRKDPVSSIITANRVDDGELDDVKQTTSSMQM